MRMSLLGGLRLPSLSASRALHRRSSRAAPAVPPARSTRRSGWVPAAIEHAAGAAAASGPALTARRLVLAQPGRRECACQIELPDPARPVDQQRVSAGATQRLLQRQFEPRQCRKPHHQPRAVNAARSARPLARLPGWHRCARSALVRLATGRIARPHALEEGLVLPLEAVGFACRGTARRRHGRVEVEPQRQIRLAHAVLALLHPVLQGTEHRDVEARGRHPGTRMWRR